MITASLTTLWSAVSSHNAAGKSITSRAKFHNVMGFYLRDNEIIMSIVKIHTDLAILCNYTTWCIMASLY